MDEVRLAERAMDPFERPYWFKLQVELWVCTRSREAVGLAEHAAGRTRLADLNIGPDGLDDEAYEQETPMFGDEIELIGTAITNYGFVCEFDDARKEVVVALSTGQLQEHQDRSSGAKFFEREEVLRLWPDTLRATTERLTLAEAVALLVRGRPASKESWRRLRRRHRGRFPPAIRLGIEEAGQAIVEMIRRRDVEAWGRFCDRKRGTGLSGIAPITDNGGFLAEPPFVDPCENVIRTEFDRGDGELNPADQEYRDVVLNRTQFLETIKTRGNLAQAEGGAGSRARQDDAPDYRSEDTVVIDLGDAINWIAFGYAGAPTDHRATAIWDDAERELVRALQLGEVVALGFRHGRGERQEIPASFWIDAELEPLKSYAFRKNEWSRENEWEQVRLYRHEIVHWWPSPLSVIQHDPAVEASPPAEVSVADTPQWWSLTAVEAWILARDPAAVAALCRSLSAVEKAAIVLTLRRHTNKTPRAARRELLDALAAAEVVAHGDLGTGKGLQPIPAVEWSRLRYLYEDGHDRAGPYRDVVIARAEALRRWPEYDRPLASACAPLAPAESPADRSKAGKSIKRRGGRAAHWVKHLRKYLRLRLQRGDDIWAISLTNLRADFLSYATLHQIRNVPKARSALDEQIKRARPIAIAEHQEHGCRDGDVEAPLGETLGMPEIRRE